MARAQPSDAHLGKLIHHLTTHYAMSRRDVEKVLNIKPRQAWFYIDKLREDGVVFLRYKDKNRKYYSLRTKDELRTTDQRADKDAHGAGR